MIPVTQCNVEACKEPGAALIEARSFCRQHFILACSARLSTYTTLEQVHRLGEIPVELLKRFIHDCMREADRIEKGSHDLDNHERAGLLDIILQAADLGRHLRRSPRKAATIPIQLYSKEPRKPWREDTETRLVSRYGALTKCKHPVEIDETLRVVRTDTGRTADARVAWFPSHSHAPSDIGIEFLDNDNFWGVDWDAA
jgi:hypothetical protein